MIAIWGANGFIGRHLVNSLAAAGGEMRLFARDFEGFPFPLPRNAKSYSRNFADPFSYVADIRGCRAVVLLVSDRIGPVHVTDNLKNYTEFFRVLKQAEALPKHVVYASSGGAIYGKTEPLPITEEHPLRPITPYGREKQQIESLIAAESASYSILRVANPVGVWCKRKALVGAALEAVRTGQPMTVFGNGNTVRDYFDVRELAGAIDLCLETMMAKNTVFNVGSGKGRTINEVIEIVSSVTGNDVPVKHEVARDDVDVPYNVLDCSKVKQALGWQATKELKDIVETMWERE